MTKREVELTDDASRGKAARACYNAPVGTLVSFKTQDDRTLDQNAMMWPLLATIAKEVNWYGRYYTAEDWKTILSASLRGYEAVPGIDPGSMVVLGQSTSKMDKETFSNLIELILSFGAQQGVDLTDPRIKEMER